jgi:hypothetical protein
MSRARNLGARHRGASVDRGRVPAWSLRESGLVQGEPEADLDQRPAGPLRHRRCWFPGGVSGGGGGPGDGSLNSKCPASTPYYFQTLKFDEVFSCMADAGFETPVELK